MPLLRRRLDLPPDPLVLARALGDRPGLCVLWTASGEGPSFVTCDPVATVEALDPEPALGFSSDPAHSGVPRWIGLLPYEACRHLERSSRVPQPDVRPEPHLSRPIWGRYSAVLRVSDGVEVIGDDREQMDRIAALAHRSRPTGTFSLGWAEAPEDDERHVVRIERALALIAAGELYQVNLARRFALRVDGDRLALLAAMSRHAAAPYAAALQMADVSVVSLSPELFLRVSPRGEVLTRPIKGSRPRGRTEAEDAALIRQLETDPKERAELTMVIDIERNDLGRVCEAGTVRLSEAPAVQTLPSIHHRVAGVSGQLRPEVGRAELLGALLPSGSITGAPKVRAMEVIAELEAHRRGLYTGAIGYVAHDGGLELSMAIRTLSVRAGIGHYFAGGGIVADSRPELEVEETRWKALSILALAGKPP